MKLFKEIPQDRYNDVEWVLNWLKENPKEIGDEDVKPIKYFHCFWITPLTELQKITLKSLLDTNPDITIMFWTPDVFKFQTNFYHKRIQYKSLDRNEFYKASASPKSLDIIYSKYAVHDLGYVSDIVRFVVLNIYGGIWCDLDILFLRDLNDIKINRYMSQWGTDMMGNAAILRLEQGHDLIDKIVNACPHAPFYPGFTFKGKVITPSFLVSNDLDVTMFPSTFFDILWRPGHSFEEAFTQGFELPDNIFCYHWHNRFNDTPHVNSVLGKAKAKYSTWKS